MRHDLRLACRNVCSEYGQPNIPLILSEQITQIPDAPTYVLADIE